MSREENDVLTKPFSKEEIKSVVFSCYAEGALGLDGVSFLFYQRFWDLIKNDLLAMFNDFHQGRLDLYRLNFSMITLIPKEEGARSMKKFRPISLINCSYKIFSKALTLRLGKIIDRLVSPHQSAFIQGCYILESVVISHELVHSVHNSNEPGCVIKLDYKKAYDRVSWDFLFEILESRGFSPIWINWIEKLIKKGSVGVMLNGEESIFFKTWKVLRQGDPLFPLLFNLVGDILTRMLIKGGSEGLIRGLGSNFSDGGIISLQYADDTILFSDVELEHLLYLKVILMWFE